MNYEHHRLKWKWNASWKCASIILFMFVLLFFFHSFGLESFSLVHFSILLCYFIPTCFLLIIGYIRNRWKRKFTSDSSPNVDFIAIKGTEHVFLKYIFPSTIRSLYPPLFAHFFFIFLFLIAFTLFYFLCLPYRYLQQIKGQYIHTTCAAPCKLFQLLNK